MRRLSLIFTTVFLFAMAFAISLEAKNVIKTTIAGNMRIELHILPAEPFFTAEEVASNKVKEGMLIISGAAPLLLEANKYENRHLVVHLYNAKTGKALTTAKVTMTFQQLDTMGEPAGNPINVPIVNMQIIGKGLESTHYGNNVVMPEGNYLVVVVANGKKVGFHVTVTKDRPSSSDKMHMH